MNLKNPYLVPELAAIAAMLPRFDLNDIETAREVERQAVAAFPPYEPPTPLAIEDVTIPGYGDAPDVVARLYRPALAGNLPVVIGLHGGGWALGNVETLDAQSRLIASKAQVAVVNVDYRLAPEHPYPAALEDAYSALAWVGGAGCALHGFRTDRIGVWGESAGGGLAAAVTMLARDSGGPAIAAQFLVAPTTDDRLSTESMRELTATPLWQAANSPIAWRNYLAGTGKPGSPSIPVYAAVGRATRKDLADLPSAYLTVFEVDPTRDEGLNYGIELVRAGVPTEIHHYSGAFHIAHVIPGTKIGERIMQDTVSAFRRLLR